MAWIKRRRYSSAIAMAIALDLGWANAALLSVGQRTPGKQSPDRPPTGIRTRDIMVRRI